MQFHPLHLTSIDDSYIECAIANVVATWFSNLIISSMFISCILYRKELPLSPDFFIFSYLYHYRFMTLNLFWVVSNYRCYSFLRPNYSRFGKGNPIEMAAVSPWFIEHFSYSNSEKFRSPCHVGPSTRTSLFFFFE